MSIDVCDVARACNYFKKIVDNDVKNIVIDEVAILHANNFIMWLDGSSQDCIKKFFCDSELFQYIAYQIIKSKNTD